MDRIALVIGNSDYSNVGKLNNPKNDADDIASILNKLNFDVTKIMDANLIDIQKSVNDFLQALDEYAVGVFFYAGHGSDAAGDNSVERNHGRAIRPYVNLSKPSSGKKDISYEYVPGPFMRMYVRFIPDG